MLMKHSPLQPMVSGGSAARHVPPDSRVTPPISLPQPVPEVSASLRGEPISPLRQEIADMLTPAPPPTWRDEARVLMQRADSLAHRRPGMAVLAVFGLGLALGVASYEILKPHATPKKRAARSLDELQASLRDMAAPAAERAAKMTRQGVKAVKQGLHSAAHSKLVKQLREIFA